jgi:hypothetical protein
MRHFAQTSLLGRPLAGESPAAPARDESRVQLLIDFDRSAAPQSAVNPSVNDDPASHFALRFAALLEADSTAAFNNAAISQLAREIFGSSAGFARDAYDAAEAGFNIYLNRVGFDLSSTPAAIDRLLAEQKRLPLQSRRDQNQIDFQQFSTPPAEALVVVKAAALCAGMTVLDRHGFKVTGAPPDRCQLWWEPITDAATTQTRKNMFCGARKWRTGHGDAVPASWSAKGVVRLLAGPGVQPVDRAK